MLVIEQPDGTMALVPEWMTRPAAAAVEIREAPRFPLAELRALRQVVVAVLSLPSGSRQRRSAWDITHSPLSGSFSRERQAKTSLPPAVMERLLLLVGQLLRETAAVELAVMEQVDEHQDHA
jgi:hypothetical protein